MHKFDRDEPIKDAPDAPPREVAETWAGSAVFTTELVRLGFIGRAYECAPQGVDTHLPEGDIMRKDNQDELMHQIEKDELYALHEAPDCSSWSLMQNMNKTTRTLDLPQGDGTLAHDIRGNESMAVALWLFWELFTLRYFCFFRTPGYISSMESTFRCTFD